MPETLIVSSSGIRGVVGRGLTPETVARYGAAYATHLAESAGADRPPGQVIVGRDTRPSGALLADAAAAGLRAAGADVLDAGVAPTPTLLLAVAERAEVAGAVVVTASHNPVEWNGLKLAGRDGRFIAPEAGARVEALVRAGPVYASWDGPGGREAIEGVLERHLDRICALPLVDPARIAARGLTVALDCVHGAGALLLPALLERLGCRVVGIGMEPDGLFPRDPEPRAENLGPLGVLVREERADLGMAVDPDGDRLALVDEDGEPLGEDWTLALAVELVLAHRQGPVVTNLSSSRCVRDVAERAGQPFHLAPVGEANVARRMEEVGAVVGGEGNGGVMLPELNATRDAALAAALVLQLVAERRAPLGRLLHGRPRYHVVKRKVPHPGGALEPAYAALAGAAPEGREEDRQDGLRLEWPADGTWVHVRPSGTEPIVRIVAEARDEEEAERLADWAEGVLEKAASGA